MTTAKQPAVETHTTLPYRLVLDINVLDVTEDQFLKLCSDNSDLRLELTAKGELIIMPPTGGDTGTLNFRIVQRFGNWVDVDDTGVPFDSSTGFLLPNRAIRSPDVSWVRKDRWEALTDGEEQNALLFVQTLCWSFAHHQIDSQWHRPRWLNTWRTAPA